MYLLLSHIHAVACILMYMFCSMSPDTLEMQVSSRDLRVHLETCSSSCAAACHTEVKFSSDQIRI